MNIISSVQIDNFRNNEANFTNLMAHVLTPGEAFDMLAKLMQANSVGNSEFVNEKLVDLMYSIESVENTKSFLEGI